MGLRKNDLAPARGKKMKKQRGIDELAKLFVRSYLSPNTKAAYAKDLELFFAFCKQEGWIYRHPREIESRHLQQYRDHLIEQNQAGNTIIRKMVAIRSLLQWCVHEGEVDRNPLLNVRLPKAKQVMSTLDFSDDEARNIMALPRDDRPSGALHGLVLTLLFYLGLRRSEAIEIKMQDFFEERGHIVLRIRGKGEKYRDIPILPLVKRAIDHYVQLSGKTFTQDSHLLQPISNRYSKVMEKSLHPSSIDWIVKHYSRKAGVKRRISPHSCRATVVGNLLDHRVPIRDVASLIGHASIQTTSLYDKRKQNLDRSAARFVSY